MKQYHSVLTFLKGDKQTLYASKILVDYIHFCIYIISYSKESADCWGILL